MQCFCHLLPWSVDKAYILFDTDAVFLNMSIIYEKVRFWNDCMKYCIVHLSTFISRTQNLPANFESVSNNSSTLLCR